VGGAKRKKKQSSELDIPAGIKKKTVARRNIFRSGGQTHNEKQKIKIKKKSVTHSGEKRKITDCHLF